KGSACIRAGEANSPGIWGKHLTKRRQAALVAALACASLLAMTLATETAAARGSKSSSAATKSAGKAAKASGKKQSASKSKDKSDSKSALSVPLAPGPAPETPEADVALVKSAIAALRSSNSSKATEIQANISDPTARKLVEWLIL